MRPLVTVVVVNYNRAQLLKDCLESLLTQTYSPIEVLVVDNGSTDDSCRIVEALGQSHFKLIRMNSNLGFAAANNVALEQAGGEFVALLNNDAVAEPDWIERLMETIEGDPGVGMCASKILMADARTIDKTGHLIYLDGQNRGRGTGEPDIGQYEHEEEALFPDGCAAFYRRSALKEVEGFDQDFFAYADDADLGLRLRWKGWRCRYVPRAVVYHHHASTSGRFSAQRVYWIERNRIWLALKNLPFLLLFISPVMTAHRVAWNLLAWLTNQGAAGNFREGGSSRGLLWALLRAYRDAAAGIPAMWSKRRKIQRGRCLRLGAFIKLFLRFRISAYRLAFFDQIPKDRAIKEETLHLPHCAPSAQHRVTLD